MVDMSRYRIAVSFTERRELRYWSKHLSAFDLEVVAALPERLDEALRSYEVDFLLVNKEAGPLDQVHRAVRRRRGDPGAALAVLLIGGEEEDADRLEEIDGVFVDLLARPLVLGELLSRLRTMARLAVWSDAERDSTGIDPLTSVLTSSALLATARRLAANRSGDRQIAVFDVDYFRSVQRASPWAATAVVQRMVDALTQTFGFAEPIGRLGADRFAVVIAEQEPGAARRRCEAAVAALAESQAGEADVATASVGLARLDGNADEAIANALKALDAAKTYGGNWIQGEDDEDVESLTAGDVFADAKAEHVMTPCTVLIHEQCTVSETLEQLAGSDCGVAVNERREPAGVVNKPRLLAAEVDSNDPVSNLVEPVPCVELSTPLAEVMKSFGDGALTHVIACHESAPRGYISRSSLVALNLQLQRSTFHAQTALPSGAVYVPDYDPLAD